MKTMEQIKERILKLNNDRFKGGAGHPGQSYNAIPFPEFQDMSVWRRSEDRLKMVFDDAGDVSGKRVLDLGCNVGNWSFEFSKRGATVTSFDIDQDCVDIANAIAILYNQKATFHQQELSLTFLQSIRDQHYDIVLCLSILHTLIMKDPNIDLREVFRILEGLGDVVYFEMGGIDKYPAINIEQDLLKPYVNFKYVCLGRDNTYNRPLFRMSPPLLSDFDFDKSPAISENSTHIHKVGENLVIVKRGDMDYLSVHYYDILSYRKSHGALNFSRVYDVDSPYILREYIHGEALITLQPTLELIETLERDMKDIMGYLKLHKILHRDITSFNLIYNKISNRFILIDWQWSSWEDEPCGFKLTNEFVRSINPLTRNLDYYMVAYTLQSFITRFEDKTKLPLGLFLLGCVSLSSFTEFISFL
jgi:SAM-dependent methyltransferase